MQDHAAKMSVLDKIIGMMTDHQMKGLKKKGAPSVTEVEVHAGGPAALADAGDKTMPDAKEPDGDEESPELLQKLMELYGKKDDEDEEDGTGFKKATQPTQITGSN